MEAQSTYANVMGTFHTIMTLLDPSGKRFQDADMSEKALNREQLQRVQYPAYIGWNNVHSRGIILERLRDYFQKVANEYYPREGRDEYQAEVEDGMTEITKAETKLAHRMTTSGTGRWATEFV